MYRDSIAASYNDDEIKDTSFLYFFKTPVLLLHVILSYRGQELSYREEVFSHYSSAPTQLYVVAAYCQILLREVEGCRKTTAGRRRFVWNESNSSELACVADRQPEPVCQPTGEVVHHERFYLKPEKKGKEPRIRRQGVMLYYDNEPVLEYAVGDAQQRHTSGALAPPDSSDPARPGKQSIKSIRDSVEYGTQFYQYLNET